MRGREEAGEERDVASGGMSGGMGGAIGSGWRTLAKVAVLVLAAGALGGASCSVSTGCDDDYYDDDDDGWFDDDDDGWDDDDDDCDDDDDGSSSAAGAGRAKGAVDWTLRDYQQIEAQEPDAAPIAGLIAIKGFSLSRQLGPGVFGDPQIRLFTEQVLSGNPQLFALPPEAGTLRFDAIDHEEHFILVRYAQERIGGDGVAQLRPGATLTFVLDLHGKLVEVQNQTKMR